MASRVTVHINSRDVYKAIGTPGGPVYNWREATAEAIVLIAKRTAPENTPGNAAHRGGGTGGFKRGFDWEPYGNQHVLGARIYNDAPHAIYAELGRGGGISSVTSLFEFFSDVLGEDDWKKVEDKLRDGMDVELLANISNYLIGEWSGRPTNRSSASTPTRNGTGPKSTAKRPAAVRTTSRSRSTVS